MEHSGDLPAGTFEIFIAGPLACTALHRHLSGAGVSAGRNAAEIEHRKTGNDGDHRNPADVGEFCIAYYGMAVIAVKKRNNQRYFGCVRIARTGSGKLQCGHCDRYGI